MRYILFSLLLPVCLTSFIKNTSALESSTKSSPIPILVSESIGESFYTQASGLVQQQINLIFRIEQALIDPDANRIRAVRGQLIVQTKTVENFLQRQSQNPQGLCDSGNISPSSEQYTKSQTQIYCSLYGSSQELLKIAPVLDRLLSRRGELALIKRLPLVTGERQSDPVLAVAPVQHPHLNQSATPFSIWEPNLSINNREQEEHPTQISSLTPPQIVGRAGKTAIANYVPPSQPAIAPPEEALTVIATAKELLTAAQVAFPSKSQFTDPWENQIRLDHFAYGLDPQEPQTYAKFLELPDTGIFRVLPVSAYQRQLNTLRNRLQLSVSERYPFPDLGDAKGGFKPSLALQVVGDRFELRHSGVNYSFMVDVGDLPLEKLDGSLKSVPIATREFFLNYKPPQQLDALQIDKRRFLTGKDQNWQQSQVFLASSTAKLNHTYIVRSLQFQLPEIVLNTRLTDQEKNTYINQLRQIRGSDIILAFRPVRSRSDGSYTVLWRVLNKLPAPQLKD